VCGLSLTWRVSLRCCPQGSTCIYSKKVECLYTLVFQTLDMVTAQKRSSSAKNSAAGKNGEDLDIMEQEEQFLALDDVMKEAGNINMNDDDEETSAAQRRHGATPRSRLGALRLQQSLGADTFRITTSAMHSSGALLLDTSSRGLLSLLPEGAVGTPLRSWPGAADRDAHAHELHDASPGGDSDYDGGLGAPDTPGDNADAGGAGMDDDVDAAQQRQGQRQRHRPDDVDAPRTGPRQRQPHGRDGGPMRAGAAVDPWKQLDPYMADAGARRPFQRGACVAHTPPHSQSHVPTLIADTLLLASVHVCMGETACVSLHPSR
jgi:condensin-2 complex subunit H2